MRPLTFACALLALALVPAADAQSSTTSTTNASGSSAQEGCVRTDPCPWAIEVSQHGFRFQMPNGTFLNLNYDPGFTVGDWIEVLLSSMDANATHTVTLSGYDRSFRVEPEGFAYDTGAFQLTAAGTLTLHDEPSGDRMQVRILREGEGDGTPRPTGGPEDTPAVVLPAIAVALVALAALRRR